MILSKLFLYCPVGLSVMYLLTIMIGSTTADYICHKKSTAVKYSNVFVVDLAKFNIVILSGFSTM